MGRYLHKSHNVSVLLYHLVCPAKYRRVVFDDSVDTVLKNTCLEIAKRYQITFLEIGAGCPLGRGDHVHFLLQSVPRYSPTRLVTIIKSLTESLTASEIFARCPHVKKQLWGGEFWSDGYFIASVGLHGSAQTIANYVREQGANHQYQKLHEQQLTLFEETDL